MMIPSRSSPTARSADSVYDRLARPAARAPQPWDDDPLYELRWAALHGPPEMARALAGILTLDFERSLGEDHSR